MYSRQARRHEEWNKDDEVDDIINEDNEIFFHSHPPSSSHIAGIVGVDGTTDFSASTRSVNLPSTSSYHPTPTSPQSHLPLSSSQRPFHHVTASHDQSLPQHHLPTSQYYQQNTQPQSQHGDRIRASRNKRQPTPAAAGHPKSFTRTDKHHPSSSPFHGRKHKEDSPDSSSATSPFVGVNLRWHNGSLHSGSESGSMKRISKKDKKKQISKTISDLQSSAVGDSMGYGAGWMVNVGANTKRQEAGGSHPENYRLSKDSHSNRAGRDFDAGPQAQYFASSMNRGNSKPVLKKSNSSPYHYQQHEPIQHQDYPLQHELDNYHHHLHHHPHHHNPHQQQHRHPTEGPRELHEMTSLNGSHRNLHLANVESSMGAGSLRPQSPTPSSLNFNNRHLPKRESHSKTFDDFDLSIKYEIERIRKGVDKESHHSNEGINRYSTNDQKKNKSNKITDDSHLARENSMHSKQDASFRDPNGIHYGGGFGVGYKMSNQNQVGFSADLDLNSGADPSVKLREDFDQERRQRKRNHVIFLVIVMAVVVVAVVSAVLAVSLGTSTGNTSQKAEQNYSVVIATMTLRILNREFDVEMLDTGSDAFLDLATPYSLELDELFLRSNLSSVYSQNKLLQMRNGSIYATSSLTFLDDGLIKSPNDVENVIRSADIASDWKLEDALQLGQFVVCKYCAKTKLEYITVKEKPEVLLHNMEPIPDEQMGDSNVTTSTMATSPNSTQSPSPDTETTSNSSTTQPSTAKLRTSTTESTLNTTEEMENVTREVNNSTAEGVNTPTQKEMSSTPSDARLSTSASRTAVPFTADLVPTASALVSLSWPSSSLLPYVTVSPITKTFLTTPKISITFPAAGTAAATTPSTTTVKQTTTVETTRTLTTPATTTMTTASTSPAKPLTTEMLTVRQEDTTLAPTVITVSNVSASSADVYVIVTCSITNPNDWSAVNVVHTSTASIGTSVDRTQTIVRLDPSELYVSATVSKLYADRVRVNYDASDTLINIIINITKLGCYDDGFVECSLAGRTVSRTSSRGRLEVTVPPSSPKLTIPVELIANREITTPISCEADLGYPPWTLRLTAQLPGTASPYPIPAEQETTENGCQVTMIRKFRRYIPSLTANGTILRCELEKKDNSGAGGHTMVEESYLLVVRDTVCQGQPDKSTLRHPYDCSSWILCEGQRPSVSACPSGQCYDPVSGNCGARSVIMESTPGILNEGLASITCSVIHVIDWSELIIRRVTSSAQTYDVVSVPAGGNVTWHDPSLGSRAVTTFRTTAVETVLEVWIYVLKCGDEGTYMCSVTGQTAGHVKDGRTELKVYVRPDPPELTISSMADGITDHVSVMCEANLGRPAANLTLKKKLPAEAHFRPVSFTDVTHVETTSCMPFGTGEYVTSASREVNGTVYRCEVTSSSGIPELMGSLSYEEQYYALSANMCDGVGSTLLPHPTDCRYFVQCAHSETSVLSCGAGRCFNATSQRCDILTPEKGQEILNGLCQPGSITVYQPHPSLCNKYVFCEEGREVIQHCPQAELYLHGGSCTPYIKESYCYKNLQ